MTTSQLTILPSLSLPILACLAAAPASGLQSSTLSDQHAIEWTVPGSGSFGRVVAGALPGSMGLSVVVMREGQATVVFDPMHAADMWPLDDIVNDVAFADDGSGTGSECIYAVTASGTNRYRYDPENPLAGSDGFLRDEAAPSAPPNASFLAAGDLNGDGLVDLVAVGPDRLSLYPFLATGSGWQALPHIDLDGGGPPRVVRDLSLVEFDGTPVAELAVCSEWGLEVYELDGSVVHAQRCYDDDNFLAVLHTIGQSDRLALVHKNRTLGKRLLTVSGIGGFESPLELKDDGGLPLSTTGIAAGDWDGDGADDLLLVHDASDDVRILIQQPPGSGQSYDADELVILSTSPAGSAIAGERSQPLFRDLDAGGGADAFVVLDGHQLALCAPGDELAAPLVPPGTLLTGPSHPVLVRADFWLGVDPYGNTPGGQDCQLDLYVRDDSGTWGLTSEFNDIEVLAWYQPHSELSTPSEEDRYGFTVGHWIFKDIAFNHPIGEEPPFIDTAKLSLRFAPVGYAGQSVAGHQYGDPDILSWSDCYYFELRLVHWTHPPAGVALPPSQVKRTYLAGVTADDVETIENNLWGYLTSREGAWPAGIWQYVDGEEWVDQGGPLVGGLVPQTRIPRLPPGQKLPIILPPVVVQAGGVGQ